MFNVEVAYFLVKHVSNKHVKKCFFPHIRNVSDMRMSELNARHGNRGSLQDLHPTTKG